MKNTNQKHNYIKLISIMLGIIILIGHSNSLQAMDNNTIDVNQASSIEIVTQNADTSYIGSSFEAIYNFDLGYNTFLRLHATVRVMPGGRYVFQSINKFDVKYNFYNYNEIRPLSVGSSEDSISIRDSYMYKTYTSSTSSRLVYSLSNLSYSLSSDNTICYISVTGTVTSLNTGVTILPGPTHFSLKQKAMPGMAE